MSVGGRRRLESCRAWTIHCRAARSTVCCWTSPAGARSSSPTAPRCSPNSAPTERAVGLTSDPGRASTSSGTDFPEYPAWPPGDASAGGRARPGARRPPGRGCGMFNRKRSGHWTDSTVWELFLAVGMGFMAFAPRLPRSPHRDRHPVHDRRRGPAPRRPGPDPAAPVGARRPPEGPPQRDGPPPRHVRLPSLPRSTGCFRWAGRTPVGPGWGRGSCPSKCWLLSGCPARRGRSPAPAVPRGPGLLPHPRGLDTSAAPAP